MGDKSGKGEARGVWVGVWVGVWGEGVHNEELGKYCKSAKLTTAVNCQGS